MLRAGLFMYDNMGGRKLLPATRTRNLAKNSLYDHLQDRLKTGYEYSDCWVEDARLVVLNALDSHERGGKILTETQVMSISGQEGLYHASSSKMLMIVSFLRSLMKGIIRSLAQQMCRMIMSKISPKRQMMKFDIYVKTR